MCSEGQPLRESWPCATDEIVDCQRIQVRAINAPGRRCDQRSVRVAACAPSHHDPRADVGIQGGTLGSDGLWNNNDFVVYVDLFFVGC
jgi:hypothetical protein